MTSPVRSLKLRVSEVIRETADALSLVFETEDAETAVPSYRPGQFLTLRIPCGHEGHVARSYSLSGSPYSGEGLKVTVKRIAGGVASNWLCDNAVAGLELEALAPAGVFGPGELDRDFLLIAAGSGITPIMSILTSALSEGHGRIVLFYVNRDGEAVIFDAALQALARSYPDRLTMHHWRTAEAGRPTRPALQALTSPYAAFDAFICGPRGFMDEACQALVRNGMPSSRIAVEEFSSLVGDPFNQSVAVAPPDGGPAVNLEVDLHGTVHHLSWPEETPLLDLLLSQGIDAPYFCREGACHTCTGTLAAGRVRMPAEGIIEADGDRALILACQTLPDGVDATVRFLNS